MKNRMNPIVESDLQDIVSRELPWEKLSGCRVVVTGVGGFLGGYIARTLLGLHTAGKVNQPLQVIGLARNLVRVRDRFQDISAGEKLELKEWDLNTIAVPDLGTANYVIHAGSHASPRYFGTDPVGTLLPNAVGTAALLEALHRSPDPRGLLFISSSEVYGAVADNVPLAEAHFGEIDPAVVRSCYAESKRLGETLCVAWYHQHKLPTFIVRPFHTYGPGLQPDDGRVFADFVFNVIRNENIVMMSDGAARRAFCYVSDAIAGFFTVLLKGECALPYNVANPAGELSVMDLAELMVALYPDKNLVVERRQESGESGYLASTFNRLVPDVRRLTSLGWQANVDPASGFQRMIEAYQL
jgi:UDP-glucuronate decarboxylase